MNWHQLKAGMRKIRLNFSSKQPSNKFDGKIRIYPTLRCNLQCPYCSNFLNEKYTKHVYHELTKDDWLKIIEKVNRGRTIPFPAS